MHLADRSSSCIDRGADDTAEQGLPARIIAKMNSLVDPGRSRPSTPASQAGVRIDLIVRGICCLRPWNAQTPREYPGHQHRRQVPRALADRLFPEQRQSRRSSSPRLTGCLRNFRRRVEIMFPIEDPRLQQPDRRRHPRRRLDGQREGTRAPARWDLSPDRSRRSRGEPVVRSQVEFQNMARELSSTDPIRHPPPPPQPSWARPRSVLSVEPRISTPCNGERGASAPCPWELKL